MKTLLGFLLMVFSVASFGVAQTSIVPTSQAEYSLNRNMGSAAQKYSVGSLLKQAHNTAVGVYDYSLTGGAIGQHAVGETFPDDGTHDTLKAFTVAGFAVIEPPALFGHVPNQVVGGSGV